MSILKALTVFAWAGVLIASAARADAIAVTTQGGNYASCSASYSTQYNYFDHTTCGGPVRETYDADNMPQSYTTFYSQQIKLVSTACSAGGCSPDSGAVYTDFVYPAGRKSAYQTGTVCVSGVYEFDSCQC
jgi:hypothetical protein